MDRYSVVKKYIDGVAITGYYLVDPKGDERLLKSDDVLKLAKQKKISNASVVLDADKSEWVLCVDGGINGLETVYKKQSKKFRVQGRIINSLGDCTGYILRDENDKAMKASLKKVWELAHNGTIQDIKGGICKGYKIIQGTKAGDSEGSTFLSDLPKMKEREGELR